MAESKSRIIDKLAGSAERIRRVREAAAQIREARAVGEVAGVSSPVAPTSSPTPFTGQQQGRDLARG